MAKALGPWELPDDDTPESLRDTPTVEQLQEYIANATRTAQLDYIEAIARSIGHADGGVIQNMIANARTPAERGRRTHGA